MIDETNINPFESWPYFDHHTELISQMGSRMIEVYWRMTDVWFACFLREISLIFQPSFSCWFEPPWWLPRKRTFPVNIARLIGVGAGAVTVPPCLLVGVFVRFRSFRLLHGWWYVKISFHNLSLNSPQKHLLFFSAMFQGCSRETAEKVSWAYIMHQHHARTCIFLHSTGVDHVKY